MHSDALRCTPTHSDALSAQSDTLSSHLLSMREAISGNQRPSASSHLLSMREAISGNQRPSASSHLLELRLACGLGARRLLQARTRRRELLLGGVCDRLGAPLLVSELLRACLQLLARVLQLDQAMLCLRLQMLVVAQMALIFRESARSAHLKLVVALLARGAAAAHLAQRARQAGSRLLQDRAR